MGKTGNTIKMLTLLKTGRCIPVDELAVDIGTKKRNIYEYRNELEMAGYIIKESRGPGGGYRLNTNSTFPVVSLSPSEREAVKNAYLALIQKNYVFDSEKGKLAIAFGKIFSSIKGKDELDDATLVYDKWLDTMPKDEVARRYEFIKNAIANLDEIEILYNFVQKDKEWIKFHPYNISLYKDAWYFEGLNLNENEVYYRMKLTRIEEFRKTGKKYTIWEGYKKSDKDVDEILGNTGFNVTYIARGSQAKIIKERKFGENQIIEDLPDGSIKVSAEFKSRESLLRFLTSGRENITVLEPKDFQDELIKYAKFILDTYA